MAKPFSRSPESKKPTGKYDSPLTEALKQDEDEVMTALNMSEEVTTKVQKIWKSVKSLTQ